MSSSAVPYNPRNPFVRWADAWYGVPQGQQDAGAYSQFGRDLIFPDATMADLSSRSYWNPDIAAELSMLPGIDPTKPVGYIRFNTGRPTMDAIASVVLNNVGMDNLLRAKSGVTRGDWGAYFRNVPIGTVEALLAVSGAGLLANTMKKAVTRSVVRVAGGTPLPPVAGTPYTIGGRTYVPQVPAYGPTPVTTAAAGPRGITQVPAAVRGWTSNVAQNVASRFNAQQPIRSTISSGLAGIRGIARNVRAYPGRYGLVAFGAGILGSAIAGTPRETASATAARMGVPDEPTTETPTAPSFNFVPPSGDGGAAAAAAESARINVAAINRQYDNILRELQDAYQLSETDEERERIRFMLADIEAQRDAGLQAISEGYAQTVAAIQERATISRDATAQRSRQFGAELEGYADRTAQRMILQNLQQQQQFRGLGSGSQDPVNEWVGLMSAMAPLQEQYTQRTGDITAEGIDWLGETVGAQGQAQQADLQRLAAATRSAALMQHQAQVANRIERERQMQRDAMMQVMMQQAGAVQSAEQFNAQLAAQLAGQQFGMGEISSLAFGDPLEGGLPGLSPEGVATFIGRQLTPQELSMAQARYQQGLTARGQQAVTTASTRPPAQNAPAGGR